MSAPSLREPEMRRVVRAIIDARPKRVSVGGGEPLLVPWWEKMFGLFKSAGIPLTVFTSGWVFDDEAAEKLASLVATTTVSVDGPNAAVHDLVRGRAGSFDRAMAALERLTRIRRERTARGEDSCTVALDYTVTRSGLPGIDDFVAEASARHTIETFLSGRALLAVLVTMRKILDDRVGGDPEPAAWALARSPSTDARGRRSRCHAHPA
ncbi:radical SAM protein [Streptomyces sp. GMR22]|uniref:radical SAM protein n=1 Tax=Streptomyces sp. GMR22 TaxID=2759524 RepID=UPI0015FAAC73|nr:radical SAM protein [Streptomyces sp. GMR22]MBA6434310.1 radical SAM protein [Streptomyces sp. GMR22]